MSKNVWPANPIGLPLLGVLPACLVGVGIMRLHGAPSSLPLTNLAAVLVGMVGITLGARALTARISKRPEIIAILVLALCAATLVAEGIEGVHRWVRVGPIRLHLAAIAMPLLLLAIVILWERQKTVLAVVMLGMGLALHVVQPDAGQATALAAGAIALAGISDERYGARFVMVILAALGAIAAWMRPDPLAPVPMVEDIVPRAFAMHPGLGIGAVLALATLPGTAMAYVLQSSTNRLVRAYGVGLAAYLMASIVVVAFGEFPTPVLGFGASPVLGAILGLGMLGALRGSTVHQKC